MKRMKVREEKAAQDKWKAEEGDLMMMTHGYYKGEPVSQKEISMIRETLTMSAEDQKNILLKQYKKTLEHLEEGAYIGPKQSSVEIASSIKATKETIERIEKE